MSDFSFEEMLNDYLPETQETGDKIEATLLRKNDDYGYLNINNKLEGRIRATEIEDLEIGDKLFVQVIKKDEEFLIVSKNLLERTEAFDSIKKGDIVKGTLKGKVKGGYKVNIGLVEGFLPFRQSGLNPNHVLNPNEEFDFEVIDKNRKNVVLSRSSIVEKLEKECIDKLHLYKTVKGKIVSILDYGLIVDLNPLSAFLHFSEISWDNSKTLKNFNVGDEIEAKIIELDKENMKVKLSIKELSENPWIKLKEKYKVGQNLDGTIKEIFKHFILININDTDEGFIHISNLYYKNIPNIASEYKVGDVICCEIIDLNDEKERISLSAKTVFDKIWEDIDQIHFINDTLKIKITKIKDFGLFGKTDDNLEVFVPRSEFSWIQNEKLNIKTGDVVDVKIIKLEKETKNIVGSLKRLGKSPWEIASSKYNLNNIYNVKVTNVLENGLLVQLTDDFKGLIPKKEISKDEVKDLSEFLNKEVEAIVFEKNSNKNSILLSIKRITELEEKKELEELMKIYGVNN